MKKSTATLRAENYPHDNGEWFCEFNYRNVKGLGKEEGVVRRDPSTVILVDGLYYVWYTKSEGDFNSKSENIYDKQFPWDYADIWYATSKDGYDWEEQGVAIGRGGQGAYDERTVCTPEILAHDGKFYLVYQCMDKDGKYRGTYETVALATAEHVCGPWTKSKEPILTRREDGHWLDDYETYNDQVFEGTVHDPTLFFYNDKFYLYYKCALQKDKQNKPDFAGTNTRWGVAIADKVEGPYIPSEYNPITNSGHEVIMWQYKDGMAALLNREGPERDTIQYAKDGINFEIMSRISHSPGAAGLFRNPDADKAPLEGLRWGLWHPPYEEREGRWDYIRRFDIRPKYLQN